MEQLATSRARYQSGTERFQTETEIVSLTDKRNHYLAPLRRFCDVDAVVQAI